MNYTSTFFDGLAQLLYPHICAGCGDDVLAKEQLLCASCLDQLPFTNFHRNRNNPVEKVFAGRLNILSATSFLYYTKHSIMQSLMHQLKYKGCKEVGEFLGSLMGEALAEEQTFRGVELIVPLPLHFSREKKRGYNQSKVISDGIAQRMNIPVVTDVMIRNRRTKTQTRMNRTARWENSQGKFEVVNKDALAGKHVLLVDDVITTGATLEACGCEMLRVPGLRLSIASLAYTLI